MGSKSFQRHGKVVWPGFSNAPSPRHVVRVGRNDPCPCGSGKKYKECHESHGSAFLEKLVRADEKKLIQERAAQLKAQGIPWYRRLLLKFK